MRLHLSAPTREASSPRRANGQRRRALGRCVLRLVAVGFAAWCLAAGPASADDLKKSGTFTVEQVQIAFIGSGNLGGGTLKFGGKSYDFTIGGLGIGGFGVSKITGTGTVYNLRDRNDFAGTYGQARYGLAIGTKSTGELWLQNTKGVVLQLNADREGLALSLGADAVRIKFD
jgi:hypothetical protein